MRAGGANGEIHLDETLHDNFQSEARRQHEHAIVRYKFAHGPPRDMEEHSLG